MPRPLQRDFLARQFFLVTALLIAFLLGHTMVAGSVFSKTKRDQFAQAKAAQKDAALRSVKTNKARL